MSMNESSAKNTPRLSTALLQTARYQAELAGPSKFDPHEIRLSEAGQVSVK